MDKLVQSPYQDKNDPWSSHSLIRQWFGSFNQGVRVLDVGTATGTLGRMCQNLDLQLNGLEPNPEWAETARPYYQQVMACDLDSAPDEFLANHDVVVLADVLEHMCSPDQSLERLVSLQQPGTLFIVSVPNVTNLWVRLKILFGRFDYTDRGILDRTHMRFFDRRAFLQFLQNAGLCVSTVSVTTIPLPLVSPFFRNNPLGRFLHRALAALTQAFPTLLGYQFISKSVKPYDSTAIQASQGCDRPTGLQRRENAEENAG